MRIAATTILFNPQENYLNNIRSYASFVDKVFIVDNSENPTSERRKELAEIENVHVVFNNQNLGIAKALNQGIGEAIKDGYEWILTMDQDSSFEPTYFKNYLATLHSLPDKKEVAVTGVNHEMLYGENIKKIKSVNTLITSGSMINSQIFQKLGGFMEKLFIDEVDHEYCFRAKNAGYKILLFEHILLNHNLGQTKQVKNIINNRFTKRNLHSSIRLYYIVRNYRFIVKKYKKSFPEDIALTKKDVWNRLKNRLIYGDRKLYSLKLILLGIYHSIIGRYGKL